MKKVMLPILFSLFILLTLIGAECTSTLPQLPAPTNTPVPTPTHTPGITPTPTVTSTPIVFRILYYQDISGNDPVTDGYINKKEKENGFKAVGKAIPGEEIEAKLKCIKNNSEASLGSIIADENGDWEITITSNKWGIDGNYKMIFTSSSGEKIEQEVILDTTLPYISSSNGYAKSITSYGFEITQEAEHITCELLSAAELITATWEVYVKVGSGIVVKQNGSSIGTFSFGQGNYTKILAVPGVVIKVYHNISQDETLKFETTAPTWGSGYFTIIFNEEIQTSSIPAFSSTIGPTPTNTGCIITVNTYGSNYGVLQIIGNAEAVFPNPGTEFSSIVYYRAPSGVLDNKEGWLYIITIKNVKDKAGNEVDVETEGKVEEYAYWPR